MAGCKWNINWGLCWRVRWHIIVYCDGWMYECSYAMHIRWFRRSIAHVRMNGMEFKRVFNCEIWLPLNDKMTFTLYARCTSAKFVQPNGQPASSPYRFGLRPIVWVCFRLYIRHPQRFPGRRECNTHTHTSFDRRRWKCAANLSHSHISHQKRTNIVDQSREENKFFFSSSNSSICYVWNSHGIALLVASVSLDYFFS